MSHLILLVVVVVVGGGGVQLLLVDGGDDGEVIGVLGCAVVTVEEGDCGDLQLLILCVFSFSSFLSTSMANEWLNRWMVSLSSPKSISLQMGQWSGRFVTFTRLILSASILSKLGLQHRGQGSTWEHIAAGMS